MIYFKATRPDGTDFRTGAVDYAGALSSGEALPLLTSEDGTYECCTNTVYHASDVPSETLVGCSWPCRLFEVTGESVAQQGHKYGFRTLTVVREVPAWRALGPNGEAVSALIEQARSLAPDHGQALAAARAAARAAAWDAARAAARDAAGAAVGAAAWDAAWDAAGAAVGAAARAAARDVAGAAARDVAGAAIALVTRDLITEEQFATLYGPWSSVMGAAK